MLTRTSPEIPSRKKTEQRFAVQHCIQEGQRGGVTDRAEVKFVDGWIGFGRLSEHTQWKTTTKSYMSGHRLPSCRRWLSRSVRSEDDVIPWKTYRKTYVLLRNSWQTFKPKKNLNKSNFFNEMNVCQESPIKTYVFGLMK